MFTLVCYLSFCSSDHFPTLSADPTARDNFAKKCAEIVEYYGFDGVSALFNCIVICQ